MGKTKANKRQKPCFSGEDTDSPSRAKRYELKLFSILLLGLIRVGLSISFVITVVFIFEFSPILLAANLSANPHLHPAQFFNFSWVATRIYASHVTTSI